MISSCDVFEPFAGVFWLFVFIISLRAAGKRAWNSAIYRLQRLVRVSTKFSTWNYVESPWNFHFPRTPIGRGNGKILPRGRRNKGAEKVAYEVVHFLA